MFKFNLTKLIKDIIILNVIFFLATYILGYFGGVDLVGTLGLHPFGSEHWNPIQYLTHMFMHGGVMHIVMNMLALAFVGPEVHRLIGNKRFLILYFLSGVGAFFLHNIISSPESVMVGASGCLFGVFAAYALMFKQRKLSIIFLPFIRFKAIWFFYGYMIFEIILGIMALGDTGGGVAHFAHVGGGLTGMALVSLVWKKANLSIN